MKRMLHLMPESNPNITSAVANDPSNNELSEHAYYEKMRKQLRELLTKRREIEHALNAQEELIIKKEQEYLGETPLGNIITGFDNYTRGGLASGRKRGRDEEEREQRSRLFSRSSISWNSNAEQPEVEQNIENTGISTTPSHANSERAEGVGNHITSSTNVATNKGTSTKKYKKSTDDSEGEGREYKKVRVNFGVGRK